jgi:hypothetical protein
MLMLIPSNESLRKCNKSSLNQTINIYTIHNLCINELYAVVVPIYVYLTIYFVTAILYLCIGSDTSVIQL